MNVEWQKIMCEAVIFGFVAIQWTCTNFSTQIQFALGDILEISLLLKSVMFQKFIFFEQRSQETLNFRTNAKIPLFDPWMCST